MPVGPKDDALDTAASILHYSDEATELLVIDDSGALRLGDALSRLSPRVHVVMAGPHPGRMGGLYVKLAGGFRHAIRHFDFRCVVRFDTDALLLGPGLEQRAIEEFAANPRLGLIGSHLVDCNGERRDAEGAVSRWISDELADDATEPRLVADLRRLLHLAEMQGYVRGEHCLGGVALFSRPCLQALETRGFLDFESFAHSRLGEDHLFGMATKAAGFDLGDFVTGDKPLALRFKGLPMAPEDLVIQRKLATHSVRSWHERTEDEIREFFRDRRASGHAGVAR